MVNIWIVMMVNKWLMMDSWIGFHSHGSTPSYGWFILENPNRKWMIKIGVPPWRNGHPSGISHVHHQTTVFDTHPHMCGWVTWNQRHHVESISKPPTTQFQRSPPMDRWIQAGFPQRLCKASHQLPAFMKPTKTNCCIIPSVIQWVMTYIMTILKDA